MLYAVELFFDPKTEKTLTFVFKKMAKAKISSAMLDSKSRPHLSLAVFETDRLPAVVKGLYEFAAKTPKSSLYFSSLGVFKSTGTLFLAPTVTGELQESHRRLFQKLNPHIQNPRPYYKPGVITYHCTLGIGLSKKEIVKGMDLVLKTQLPDHFQVVEVGLVAVHFEYKPLWVEPLITLKLSS